MPHLLGSAYAKHNSGTCLTLPPRQLCCWQRLWLHTTAEPLFSCPVHLGWDVSRTGAHCGCSHWDHRQQTLPCSHRWTPLPASTCQDNCPGCSILPWECWHCFPGSSVFLAVVRSPSLCTTSSPACKPFLWALLQLPRPCLQLGAPSLPGSGTCRAFPHCRNFPAQVDAPVPGQPEVPQPRALGCRGCSQSQSQTLPGSTTARTGTNPGRHQTLDQGLAPEGLQLQLGARHSGKPQVPLERPLCPSMEGQQEQDDDPQKSRGHWDWGQQGSCLSLGAPCREQPGAPNSVSHRHWVLHPGQLRQHLPGRETRQQLQAQTNTQQRPHVCLN